MNNKLSAKLMMEIYKLQVNYSKDYEDYPLIGVYKKVKDDIEEIKINLIKKEDYIKLCGKILDDKFEVYDFHIISDRYPPRIILKEKKSC